MKEGKRRENGWEGEGLRVVVEVWVFYGMKDQRETSRDMVDKDFTESDCQCLIGICHCFNVNLPQLHTITNALNI